MNKQCPHCGFNRFIVKVTVIQEWIVNECNLHQRTYDDFVDVVRDADDNDIWECYRCGFKAKGIKFNIEE